jgi:hypothetical protein
MLMAQGCSSWRWSVVLLTNAAVIVTPTLGMAQAPTGAVTGHVYLADTNGPARLATVVLEDATPLDSSSRPSSGSASIHMSTVKTLPDGSFAFAQVAPGTYYVHASAPGYISPLDVLALSREQALQPDKEVKERMAAEIPRVRVQAGVAARADILLVRGASVTGTVLYDDGSPAAGLEVNLLVHEKEKWIQPQSDPTGTTPSGRTDDKGRYYFSGLPPREYLVEVQLDLEKTSLEISKNGMWSNGGENASVPIYSGSSFRSKDARPFRLKQGEDRAGEDVEVPLNKLHNVTGIITAARDGHTVNGGTVELLYADDRSQAVHARLTQGDPTFPLHFVPEGDYILRVTDASDVEFKDVPNASGTFPATRTEAHTLHTYGPSEQALHVDGEVSGLTIVVPEISQKSQANSVH